MKNAGPEAGVRDVDDGADDQTRTGDLLITNQLLYRLSYIGLKRCPQQSGARFYSRSADLSRGFRIPNSGVPKNSCGPVRSNPNRSYSAMAAWRNGVVLSVSSA